jgi:hypothetical protein
MQLTRKGPVDAGVCNMALSTKTALLKLPHQDAKSRDTEPLSTLSCSKCIYVWHSCPKEQFASSITQATWLTNRALFYT